MLRTFLALTLIALWASAATARMTEPPPVIDRDGLRTVIHQRDFERIEEIMAQTHEMLLAGTATPDDMRVKFHDFTTTNPDVIAFTKDWLAKYPDSPYAQTAQAWVYYTIGWNVRGHKFSRETYYLAMREHRDLHDAALGLAWAAYETDKTLIPASDAIIRLGNSTGTKFDAFEVLDDVMTTQPNWGTLDRALSFSNRGYGGTSDMADGMCEHYAPQLEVNSKTAVRACIMDASFSHLGHRRDEIRGWLAEDTNPRFDWYRVRDMLSSYEISDDQVALANHFFMETVTADYRLAQKFDRQFSWIPGIQHFQEIVLERAKEWADAELEHDPYNLEALEILLIPSHKITKIDDTTAFFKPTGEPTEEEALDYMRRRLLAAPYNSDFWLAYTRAVRDHYKIVFQQPEKSRLMDDLWTNVIVFSNHSPDNLQRFINYKILMLDQIQQAGITLFDDWDQDANIYCPMLRSHRLLEAALNEGASFDDAVPLTGDRLAQFEEILDQAITSDQCQWVLNTAVEDLFFKPAKVKLSSPS